MKNLGNRNCVMLACFLKPRLAWRWFRLMYLRHWITLIRHAGHLGSEGGQARPKAV